MAVEMMRHRQELKPLAEMNVTNLLDTAFILLMAFMIVAPAIKHGIEIELPQVAAGNLDSNKTVTIVLQRRPSEEETDRILMNDKRLTPEELTEELIKQHKIFPEMDVVIEGDANAIYETFAMALSAIKAAGIEKIGLATEPLRPDEEE